MKKIKQLLLMSMLSFGLISTLHAQSTGQVLGVATTNTAVSDPGLVATRGSVLGLANTGSNVVLFMIIGAVIILGIVLVLVSRRSSKSK